ncbi:MAG TPA: hypothetical protein VGO62_19785, partial [Myxococcota bacterium]
MALLIFLVVIAAVAALLLGLAALDRTQKQRLIDALVRDGVYAASFDGREVRAWSTPPARPATMNTAGGGKNNPARYEVRTSVEALGGRAGFRLRREGIAGALRNRLGMHDIQLGDKIVDDLVDIESPDPDGVRGLLSHPGVRPILLGLFNAPSTWDIDLEAGVLHVRVLRLAGLDAAEARGIFERTLSLADALERAADAPALPEPSAALRVDAVGAASGSPVGISLGSSLGSS